MQAILEAIKSFLLCSAPFSGAYQINIYLKVYKSLFLANAVEQNNHDYDLY